MDIEEWQGRLRAFAEERDWEQFHTPKNLAMALSVEASELVEIFQWLTADQSVAVMEADRADDVRDEIADVAIYLLRLVDVLGVDLETAVAAKVSRNGERFPAASERWLDNFVGHVRFADLLDTSLPSEAGVYVVRRVGPNLPEFLTESAAGRFKGQDPTLPVDDLAARWVEGTDVVYIGKAGGPDSGATLRSRLRQYAAFGLGRPVGHRGGRAIFQLTDWADLRVSWSVAADARALERQLIQAFSLRHGKRPFANWVG